MSKFARTLKVACVAGLIAAGCGSSGGDAPNDAGGTTGTGGSASGTGGGSGGSLGSGGSVGSGGSAGSGTDGGSGGGSGGAAGTPGTGGTVTKDGGSGGSGGVGGTDAAGPADNWDNFAKGFFMSFCVSCHNDDNSGSATRDYHMMVVVVKEKVMIGCGVAKSAADATARACPAGSPRPKQFPVGNGAKPTDAERDRLLRWIDAGTP